MEFGSVSRAASRALVVAVQATLAAVALATLVLASLGQAAPERRVSNFTLRLPEARAVVSISQAQPHPGGYVRSTFRILALSRSCCRKLSVHLGPSRHRGPALVLLCAGVCQLNRPILWIYTPRTLARMQTLGAHIALDDWDPRGPFEIRGRIPPPAFHVVAP